MNEKRDIHCLYRENYSFLAGKRRYPQLVPSLPNLIIGFALGIAISCYGLWISALFMQSFLKEKAFVCGIVVFLIGSLCAVGLPLAWLKHMYEIRRFFQREVVTCKIVRGTLDFITLGAVGDEHNGRFVYHFTFFDSENQPVYGNSVRVRFLPTKPTIPPGSPIAILITESSVALRSYGGEKLKMFML